jgi:hypothetical protein
VYVYRIMKPSHICDFPAHCQLHLAQPDCYTIFPSALDEYATCRSDIYYLHPTPLFDIRWDTVYTLEQHVGLYCNSARHAYK